MGEGVECQLFKQFGGTEFHFLKIRNSENAPLKYHLCWNKHPKTFSRLLPAIMDSNMYFSLFLFCKIIHFITIFPEGITLIA